MNRRIIQMIERSTGDFHYPVTLYEAVRDLSGLSLEEILKQKLAEFGINYSDIVDKRINDSIEDAVGALEEGDIQEVRESIRLVNNRLNSRESSLSYLAYNWMMGILPLDIRDICEGTPKVLYIANSEEEFSTDGEANTYDYWMMKDDNTIIRMKTPEDGWVNVSENTAIALYGLTTSYAKGRGYFQIESGMTYPESLGTNYDRLGDIYLLISDTEITPYVWLGTLWSTFNESPSTTIGASTMIDDLIDLMSVRYITVAYSTTEIDVDYRYDGSLWYTEYTLDESIKTFLRSLLPYNLEYSPAVTRRIYICPKKPTDSSKGDAWIDIRSNRLYIDEGNDSPVWVLQVSDQNSFTTGGAKCTNLYAKTENYDPYNDRDLWVDVRTGTYLESSITGTSEEGFGIQDLYGANHSIGQIVTLRPNTLYTYSMYVKPRVPTERPTISFLADGCEIHEMSVPSGSFITGTDYQRVWMIFTTGPNVHKSTCRIESLTDMHLMCYAPCLQEGFNKEWSPSFIDAHSGFGDALNSKEYTSIIYRDLNEIPSEYPAREAYLWVRNNFTSVKLYSRNAWVDVDLSEYPNLRSSLETVCNIYASPGITKLYTRHTTPTNPDTGDFWITDDLNAMRFTGSAWGTISGVLAAETRKLSARLMENSELLLQSIFLESSINPTDLLTLAQTLDPYITLYNQGTAPVGDLRVGDLWTDSVTGITLRYNGLTWVPTGGAKLSKLSQDIDGLESSVSEIYEAGSGRNYIRDSLSISIDNYVQVLYSGLDPDTKYVFSVGNSTAVGITQYTVRLMDPSHTFDYDNKIFTVGNTVNIWRFDTSIVPEHSPCDLVVTYANNGSNVVLNKVQLEKGHIYTDWKIALEDLDASMSVTNDVLRNVQNDLSNNINATDRLSQDLMAAIRISNEALARSVTVEQTSESFGITASALASTITDLRVQLESYSSVFSFRPEGLQISSLINGVKSDISTYYRSNGMYFWSEAAGSDVGYVTSDGLNIRNARIQQGGSLAIGNFHFKPRSNGSLSMVYRQS